jgi:hypothetical protein
MGDKLARNLANYLHDDAKMDIVHSYFESLGLTSPR